MDYYPYTFTPILRETSWGGAALRKNWGKKAPASAKIGESLEIVQDGRDVSVVDQGPLKGKSLAELLRRDAAGILGEGVYFRSPGKFPLTIKLVDARTENGLEVFPPDRVVGEERGPERVATWVILSADPGGRIRRGVLPGSSPEEFRRAAETGRLAECLNSCAAKEGDVIFLAPGAIHSLGPGVIAYEVAQNSGLATRWEEADGSDARSKARKARIDEALEVIDFQTMGINRCTPVRLRPLPHGRELLMKCERFALELLHLKKRLVEEQDGQRFVVLTGVSGHARIRPVGGGKPEVELQPGRTALIPARLPGYEIVPDRECTLLKVFIE